MYEQMGGAEGELNDVDPNINTIRTYCERFFSALKCNRPILKPNERCLCGMDMVDHEPEALGQMRREQKGDTWTIRHNTNEDAPLSGVIDFKGWSYAYRAYYARIRLDAEMEKVWELLTDPCYFGLSKPKLVISVHGGTGDFPLTEALAKAFKTGLMEASNATDAWILTTGFDSGVTKWVSDAITHSLSYTNRQRVKTIGICPWGLVKGRRLFKHASEFTARPVEYHPRFLGKAEGRTQVLNRDHKAFLFIDDGTYGIPGADYIFRNAFEDFISKQTVGEDGGTRRFGEPAHIPVVILVVEGGLGTLKRVADLSLRAPLVVVQGSGGISDVLADTRNRIGLKSVHSEDDLHSLRPRLDCIMDKEAVSKVFQRESVSVFSVEDGMLEGGREGVKREGGRDEWAGSSHSTPLGLDIVLFHATFHNQPTISFQNLDKHKSKNFYIMNAAIAWNRADFARHEFYGNQASSMMMSKDIMDYFMKEALRQNRVNFVRLFIEHGFDLNAFVNPENLGHLYMKDRRLDEASLYRQREFLDGILRDRGLKRSNRDRVEFKTNEDVFEHVGALLEDLMGNAYKSHYTQPEFLRSLQEWHEAKQQKKEGKGKGRSAMSESMSGSSDNPHDSLFNQRLPNLFNKPYNEMMIWAVLLNRVELAEFFWEEGEDALAKGLVAMRIFNVMADEASQDIRFSDLAHTLKANAQRFADKTYQLLGNCHSTSRETTAKLLTGLRKDWGNKTNLSLAVTAGHKSFVAHPACQLLLADLWMGGLNEHKFTNCYVLLGLICPLFIPLFEFKTKGQLVEQAQTAGEYVEVQDLLKHETGESQSRRDRDMYVSQHSQGGGVSRVTSTPNAVNLTIDEDDGTEPGSRRSRRVNRKVSEEPNRLTAGQDSVDPTQQTKDSPDEHDEPNITTPRQMLDEKDTGMAKEKDQDYDKDMEKKKELAVGKKLVEFYRAPITCFWMALIFYLIFLLIFSWTQLVRTHPQPTVFELIVLLNVCGFCSDNLVRVVVYVPSSFRQKLQGLSSWDRLQLFAILVYFTGFALRCASEETRGWGRVVLAVSLVLFYLQLLNFAAAFQFLGVHVTIALNMSKKMIPLLSVLLIFLTAFGVAWQSIKFPTPESPFTWKPIRNVFFHPYFMLYGEVYAGEIDECGDQGRNCQPLGWVAPILLFVFLLIANIVIINLLIAVFNNIYDEMSEKSDEDWKFHRYWAVLEFEAKGPLPSPLRVVLDAWRLVVFAWEAGSGKSSPLLDPDLKAIIEPDGWADLNRFEMATLDALHP